MKCEKCNTELSPKETYEHAGRKLCEDCYLEAVAQPKACDPWAVYLAKKSKDKQPSLTQIQQKILDTLEEKGPLTQEEICDRLGIDNTEFQNNLATLRHLELARGCLVNGEKRFTLFQDTTH